MKKKYSERFYHMYPSEFDAIFTRPAGSIPVDHFLENNWPCRVSYHVDRGEVTSICASYYCRTKNGIIVIEEKDDESIEVVITKRNGLIKEEIFIKESANA